MLVRSTKELEIKALTTLVYGATGSKKTRFTSTWPDPFVISTAPDDKGVYSLRDKDVAYVQVKKWNELSIALESVRAGTLKRLNAEGKEEKFAPKTINLDALSFIPALQREAQTGTDPPWLRTIEDVRNCVKDFKTLELHFNLVCLELLEKDEVTGALVGGPLLPGRVLPREIPAICDLVIHMKNERVGEKTVTTLYFVQHGFWSSKDRFGKLPPTLSFTEPEEPTFDAIWQYLSGAKGKEEEKRAKK